MNDNKSESEEIITLDGEYGEGGGQILRTALALSMLTKKSFKIVNIRKNRPNPGLKHQHLAGINALCKISKSVCFGIEIGSQELEFHPSNIEEFKTTIDIETAGPITLVLQSIMLPLMFEKKDSRIKLIGGTNVNWSPSIDYFKEIILPQLTRFAEISIKIKRRGYYPKGEGKVEIIIKPKFNDENFEDLLKKVKENVKPFELTNQGKLLFIKGVSHATKDLLEADVCERQKKAARNMLNKINAPIMIKTEYVDASNTGSDITLYAGFSDSINEELDKINPVILGSESIGEKGKRSEIVGEEAAKKLFNEINNKSCVDVHLADNLLPFLAISNGVIKTSEITEHIKSNIYVIGKFLNVKFVIDEKNKMISVKHTI